MKKWMFGLMAAVLLTGCAGTDRDLQEAEAFRSRWLSESVSFTAKLSAHYEDARDDFTLSCTLDPEGVCTWQAEKPDCIAGISGTVSGETGGFFTGETLLAFPLLAGDRLSPVSGPWLLGKAVRTGRLRAVCRERELLHLTLDDTYAEDPFTLELWIRDGKAEACEVGFRGRRILSMELESFSIG